MFPTAQVNEGDDEGAKDLLAERASVNEALEKTSTKAQVNFKLAAKLGTKIGKWSHVFAVFMRGLA